MRVVIQTVLLRFIVLASPWLALTPAHAGWSVDPVTVRSTTASIPLVAGCNDGGFGTFVAWQEEATAGSGLIRVQHLLPSGDRDPSWPVDGGLASDVAAARTRLGALPDRLGGVYVWWTEPNASGPRLSLNRLTPTGAVGSGWPNAGRFVAGVDPSSPTPKVISDGANGIFMCWTATGSTGDPTNVRGVHLGPSNTGVGGWPSGPRVLVPDDAVATIELWPQIALAQDGGIFVAWGSWSQDEASLPSDYRLKRLTSAGLTSPGWDLEGQPISAFHPTWLGIEKGAGLLALSHDDRGGVWALTGDATEQVTPAPLVTTLYRLQGDGQSAADWPAAGLSVPGSPESYLYTREPASYRIDADGLDGAFVGMPWICGDCPPTMSFERVDAAGSFGGSGMANAVGLESLPKGDGGLALASFYPHGPTGPFQPPASITLWQSNGAGFSEYHPENFLTWFGDVSVASCGAGQVVFFWSQSRDRFGLFARRFGATGEVTGVSGGRVSSSLSGLRFVSGRGVVARVGLDGKARLELFDVRGGRVASRDLEGSGVTEVSLPGTVSLSSGVYLARLVSGHTTRSGKVAVAR